MTKSSSHTQLIRLAQLAQLPLTTVNKANLEDSLSSVIQFIGEIDKVKVDGILPVTQVTGKTNELRNDVVTPSFSQDQALSGAPASQDGFFLVPRIIDNE